MKKAKEDHAEVYDLSSKITGRQRIENTFHAAVSSACNVIKEWELTE